MGLRTASVRRPHVAVMAPALTETAQTQNFNLPSKEPASPINSYEKNKYQATTRESYGKNCDHLAPLNGDELSNAIDNFNTFALASEKLVLGKCLTELSASDNTFNRNSGIMSVSPPSMGDQDNNMGLQKTGLDVSDVHKGKGTNDMDQLFHNFENDSEQNVDDIMQVIKSIEGSERLNNAPNDLNSENEEVFPGLPNNLTSFEKVLFDSVDMIMDDQQDVLETADKQKESQARDQLADLQKKHAKVERRLDFLRRRVYKLQSRHMGQHISGEITGVFENVHRSLKRSKEPHDITSNDLDKPKPMTYGSAKTLVRKLEMSAILQANTASRQRHTSKYFGSGSVEVPPFRSNVSGMITLPSWTMEAKQELQKVAGQLQTQLGLVREEVDSEATESSSGGESCDEMQSFNNPHQQYLSIQKRALWRYSTERASIAARWTWLQAQIADLEYRIRQHTDLHKQIRTTKGAVQLGGASPPPPAPAVPASPPTAVNGYRGQLPGGSPLSSKADADNSQAGACPDYQCARTRPLVGFRKRKLLQIAGLHAVSKKAARPSSVRCGCVPESAPCALCTGRTDPTHPRDPPDTLSKAERVALLDPSFHPVFSLPEDTSQNIHLEAIMKTPEWQQRCTRMKTLKVLSKPERLEHKSSLEHRTKKLEHRKKYGRLLKPSTMSALSAKIKNKIRGRKAGRHSLNRLHRKRHSAKDAMAQLGSLAAADGADEEVESIGNNSNTGTARSTDSPSSSPLLQMQSISGYGRLDGRSRNRIHSYDIDNIVIPYSVAASTRVEKLQYKEILTPKWRIAEPDYDTKYESKNNGIVKDSSQDSDYEDVTEEAVIARHDRCEHEEKKRFLSYLKLPVGYGRARSHKRTDSRAESSGANTPDPMSPHPADQQDGSPITSPPATPLGAPLPDEATPAPPPLPSIAVMRRRTVSQSRLAATAAAGRDDPTACPATPDPAVEVAPYERRTFPLVDEAYEKMMRHMPEEHQLKTNTRAQDAAEYEGTGATVGYADGKEDSPDSESTESAVGDGEEDPNDPEWIDMERANRERYKR